MITKSDKKKRLIYLASFIGISFFIAWAGLMEHCRTHAPTSPAIKEGRIYPKIYHGDTVYLNRIEYILMFVLPGAGFGTAVVLALMSSDRAFFSRKVK
jgi:hypothetical protein